MDCPQCKEPMIVLELEDVEIDHCVSCGGIWLDAGELELLLGDSQDKDNLLASFQADEGSKEQRIRCPICSKRMGKVLCGTGKTTCIDKCRNGHGLYFNRGELHEILEQVRFDKENSVLSLLSDMFGDKP
jgi:Zn-finger nucleic acid-binding protein